MTASPPAASHGTLCFPASFLQEELLHSVDSGASDFNVPMVWRLQGPLNREILRQALRGITDRHEVLRTRLAAAGENTVQIVERSCAVEVEEINLSRHDHRKAPQLIRRILRDAAQPFDLRHAPMTRASLLGLGTADHILLWNMNHAIIDGWSTKLLFAEFCRDYKSLIHGTASAQRSPTLQFGDYASWERVFTDVTAVEYWRKILHLTPSRPHLPVVPNWRPEQRFDTTPHRMPPVPPAVMLRLRRIAQTANTSVGLALRVGLAASLASYTDDYLIIGVLQANRDRPEVQSLVGFVADFLPLRLDLSGEPSYYSLLLQARDSWREARANWMPSGVIRSLMLAPEHPVWNGPFDISINSGPYVPFSEYQIYDDWRGKLYIREIMGRDMEPATYDREFTAAVRLAYVLSPTATGALDAWIVPNRSAFTNEQIEQLGIAFVHHMRSFCAHPRTCIRAGN